MESNITLDGVYAPSTDVVARSVAGDFVIIPVTSGIGDLEDELYTLNETAQVIWQNLDGAKSLHQVIEALAAEYDAPTGDIEKAVVGLVAELVERRILVQVTDA